MKIMNKSRTTLKTSQAISAVVEVETEMTWVLSTETEKYKIVKIGSTDYTNYYAMGSEGYGGWSGEKGKWKIGYGAMYPAYSLSEALLAIEELGKVRGKQKSENELKSEHYYYQRLLLDFWRQDGGRMDGENVSKYLLDLFKE